MESARSIRKSIEQLGKYASMLDQLQAVTNEIRFLLVGAENLESSYEVGLIV